MQPHNVIGTGRSRPLGLYDRYKNQRVSFYIEKENTMGYDVALMQSIVSNLLSQIERTPPGKRLKMSNKISSECKPSGMAVTRMVVD